MAGKLPSCLFFTNRKFLAFSQTESSSLFGRIFPDNPDLPKHRYVPHLKLKKTFCLKPPISKPMRPSF